MQGPSVYDICISMSMSLLIRSLCNLVTVKTEEYETLHLSYETTSLKVNFWLEMAFKTRVIIRFSQI